MQYLSTVAIYFVVWWITLFIVLPIGLRTQSEDGDVAIGTVASAPSRFKGGQIVLLTTLISAVICGLWYGLSWWFGFSMDDLPRIIPVYD
jgi:predicted secreted protein